MAEWQKKLRFHDVPIDTVEDNRDVNQRGSYQNDVIQIRARHSHDPIGKSIGNKSGSNIIWKKRKNIIRK